MDFDVPTIGEQAFWDDEVPLIMEQVLEVLRARGQAETFDAVVVDEAQDFAPDWWVTIETLSRAGPAARLYAFLDLNQSLRGTAKVPSVPLPARFRYLVGAPISPPAGITEKELAGQVKGAVQRQLDQLKAEDLERSAVSRMDLLRRVVPACASWIRRARLRTAVP